MNTYWLDESVVFNPNKVLLNRLMIIVCGIGLGLIIVFAREYFL